jgi:hypothetical protein
MGGGLSFVFSVGFNARLCKKAAFVWATTPEMGDVALWSSCRLGSRLLRDPKRSSAGLVGGGFGKVCGLGGPARRRAGRAPRNFHCPLFVGEVG